MRKGSLSCECGYEVYYRDLIFDARWGAVFLPPKALAELEIELAALLQTWHEPPQSHWHRGVATGLAFALGMVRQMAHRTDYPDATAPPNSFRGRHPPERATIRVDDNL
jgi:hypothetical protein